MATPYPAPASIHYRLAFEHAPIGMVLSRDRTMVDCNARLCKMFGAPREALVGQSFRVLYPSVAEFERIGKRMEPILNASGRYANNRMMKRLDGVYGALPGETFWCHMTGRAAHVMQGLTSKQIGKTLAISHRTVELHRARLMRKYSASTTAELVQKLIAG